MTGTNALLETTDAKRLASCIREIGGGVVDELEVDLDAALHGSEPATRRYVLAYKRLARRLLGAVRDAVPERVVVHDDDLALAVDGRPSRVHTNLLLLCSAHSAFSSWAAEYPLGDAVALDLLSYVREHVGAARLPQPDTPPRADFDELAAQRFVRRVHFYLDRETEPALERVLRVFALSKTELGRLFGVSRQGIDGWLDNGVPAERQDKLATILALCDVLERKLKPERIAGAARRPADAYGGLTMLEMIGADRQGELLGSVRDAFAWHEAA